MAVKPAAVGQMQFHGTLASDRARLGPGRFDCLGAVLPFAATYSLRAFARAIWDLHGRCCARSFFPAGRRHQRVLDSQAGYSRRGMTVQGKMSKCGADVPCRLWHLGDVSASQGNVVAR